MKFRDLVVFSTVFFAIMQPASAQVRQSEQTTRLVQSVADAFFDLLPKNDFAAERAFMSKSFALATPLRDWKAMRKLTIAENGSTPLYKAHQLTYYVRDTLLAAVDFSGQSSDPDTYICGFVLWEISAENTIGFFRMEQNVVTVPIFKKMPIQQAAQLMTDWHCPMSLIETVLGLSGQ